MFCNFVNAELREEKFLLGFYGGYLGNRRDYEWDDKPKINETFSRKTHEREKKSSFLISYILYGLVTITCVAGDSYL